MAGDTTYNFYGHVMLDAGYDTKQVDPSWYDVMRPTKLPAYKDQFGAERKHVLRRSPDAFRSAHIDADGYSAT